MAPSLLSLPAELRLSIWEQYARDLTLHFPHQEDVRQPHPFALVETCQFIRSEALPVFWQNLKIHCGGTDQLLDAFDSLTREQLSALRHLSVNNIPASNLNMKVFDEESGTEDDMSIGWMDVIPLFPGLQLDTLTIYNQEVDFGHDRLVQAQRDHPYVTYYDGIDQQVELGMGWKEIRFICPVPFSFTWDVVHFATRRADGTFQVHRKLREPQPATWKAMAKDRDDPGATVDIFIAKKEYDGQTNVVLDPTKREALVDTQVTTEVHRARQEGTHAFLRETMVVVRRGKQSVYVEDGYCLRSEMEDLFKGRSWKDIKKEAQERQRIGGDIRELPGLLRIDPLTGAPIL